MLTFKNGHYVMMPDYLRYPPAWFHTRILVGPGHFLTQRFAAEHNITHVINCAMDGDCPDWFPDRFPERYACIQAIDSIYANILDWYPMFEAILYRFLRQGTGVVYVHCQAGMNRSASLALAYVCKNFHLPLPEVVSAVRKQRPVVLQNPVFMNQVQEFINGCLSGAKDTRLDVDRVHDRDSGLFTPEHHPGLEGLVVHTGESEGGTGAAAVDHLGPVCEEHTGGSGPSESAGGEGPEHRDGAGACAPGSGVLPEEYGPAE
jgi:hypothetical protein